MRTIKHIIHFSLVSIIVSIIFLFSTYQNAEAVKTAPRISDSEIIESLAILKQGQIDINKRFEDVNRRIDGLQNTMLNLFGAIIALVIALFGYIAMGSSYSFKAASGAFRAS